jgi:DNA primase
LLQQPSVALALPTSLHFASLEQAGIDLLVEMIELVQQRPDISTGLILEHFAERPEAAALTRLAMARGVESTAITMADSRVLEDDSIQRQTFIDTIARLESQAVQQRIEGLQKRLSSLVDAERQELRELLALHAQSRR